MADEKEVPQTPGPSEPGSNKISMPTIDIETVKKAFEGISSADLLKIRDGERITDSAISVVLWERQKAGEVIFVDPQYEPDERIAYYTTRGNKYVGLTVTHGADVVLGLLSKFLPAVVIDLIKLIFNL